MTFNVAHWDIRNGIFGIIVCMRTISLSILMASIIYLHFGMQEMRFLSILMPSVICIHISQLVDCCVT